MNRGILMSKIGQKAILLTKDGAFQKVKIKKGIEVSVGESILDSYIVQSSPIPRKVPVTLVACLSVIIVFFLISGFVRNNAVAAYVSIDVNPSIEAAVNRDFKVINVSGLNADGEAILEDGTDYKNMPLKEFTLTISDALAENGFITDEPDIVVSTTLTDKVAKSKRDGFTQKINQVVKTMKNTSAFKKANGSLEVFNTTMDRREEAKKVGVSTGKYLVYLKDAKNEGNIKLSQVKNMTVKELHQNKNNNTIQSHSKSQKPSVQVTKNSGNTTHVSNVPQKGKKDQNYQKSNHPVLLKEKDNASTQPKIFPESAQNRGLGNPHWAHPHFLKNGGKRPSNFLYKHEGTLNAPFNLHKHEGNNHDSHSRRAG